MDYVYAVSDGRTERAGATDPSLLVALQWLLNRRARRVLSMIDFCDRPRPERYGLSSSQLAHLLQSGRVRLTCDLKPWD
jgi:hypothetical protein